MDDVKEYLRSVRNQNHAIAAMLDEIDTLRAGQMSGAAKPMDGMPHAHNHTDLSDYAAKLDDKVAKIRRRIVEMEERRERAEDAIYELEDPMERAVMVRYYLAGMTWDQVAEKTGYTTRQVLYIHGHALKHISLNFTL